MKLNKLIHTALALAAGASTLFACCGAAAATAEAQPAVTAAASGVLDTGAMFTDRDLEQTADLDDAVTLTLADGKDITVTEEGVYVLTGTAKNASVIVEADDKAKIQLVLDGVTIENDSAPCVYVKEADKVFLTTAEDSSLSVTGTFQADGDVNTDGVIFARSDLTLNGAGTLTVTSSDHGVVCKDDLKITGGVYVIEAAGKALEANDSIRIADGVLTLTAGDDGIHVENDEDDTLGYVYIAGGEVTVRSGDDAIHALSVVQIDGGTLELTAAEGIEGTYVQINDGVVRIAASDDGINGAWKSSAYRATVELNGGEITVVMAAGDTDGIDSNGDLFVNGGTVDVTGGSTFDYDGTGQYNGGTLIVNGQQVTSLPAQMGGGFGRGGGRW